MASSHFSSVFVEAQQLLVCGSHSDALRGKRCVQAYSKLSATSTVLFERGGVDDTCLECAESNQNNDKLSEYCCGIICPLR